MLYNFLEARVTFSNSLFYPFSLLLHFNSTSLHGFPRLPVVLCSHCNLCCCYMSFCSISCCLFYGWIVAGWCKIAALEIRPLLFDSAGHQNFMFAIWNLLCYRTPAWLLEIYEYDVIFLFWKLSTGKQIFKSTFFKGCSYRLLSLSIIYRFWL